MRSNSFSVRWTKTATFAAGNYRFIASADDGMRVYVDNVRIIDEWHDQASASFTTDYVLTAGVHTLKVEFYDSSNEAVAKVNVVDVSSLPAGWIGQYFNNMTLQGAPALTRGDGPTIDFSWATGSPAAAVIGVDGFSARWTQTSSYVAGLYRVSSRSDDGSRVYVDGALVLNSWVDQGGDVTHTVDINLAAGPHTVVVEYYENVGSASATASVTLLSAAQVQALRLPAPPTSGTPLPE